MQHVIVDSSYGGASVYLATLENAKKILDVHLGALDPQVVKIAENKNSVLIKESITHVLNNILKMQEGEHASKSITVTSDIKQELVMYCFKNKIEIKDNCVNEYALFNVFKVDDLSFFADNPKYSSDSILIDEYINEQVRKYKVIKQDNWKEGVTEIRKVKYILDFAQELAHRDVKYDIAEIKEEV